MALRKNMRLAALGGPNTFGGDAAKRFCELYPEFTEIVYFPTAEEALGFADDRVDAGCAPQQMARTGVHPGIQAYIHAPTSKLHVLAELTHAYHCSLLVKPGTELAQIRRVIGHTGSVSQSRAWLEKHVPRAKVEIIHTNSMNAAQQVAAADGSLASIGTPGMAREVGLEEKAKEVDGGSVGSYWVLSPHAMFSDTPDRLVVTGVFGDESRLSDLIGAVARAGFGLLTVYGAASGARLFEYQYVLRFGGRGSLAGVQEALRPFPAARLAGAFDIRG